MFLHVINVKHTQVSHLQTVIQGKVLVAFACSEQQVTCPLGVGGFMSRHLSVLRRCRLQILADPDKLLPGLRQLGQEPQRDEEQQCHHQSSSAGAQS